MKNQNKIKKTLLFILLMIVTKSVGQITTKVRPNTATSNLYECGALLNPKKCDRVQNKENAIDVNKETFATLTANSGLLIGLAAHSSSLDLVYNTVVPNNITAPIPDFYVKISTPDDAKLLGNLLGGSLGAVLNNLVGTLLLGKGSAVFNLLNGTNSVAKIDIFNNSAASSSNVKIVVAGNGDYYLFMKPTAAFNQLKVDLTNSGVVGLVKEIELNVYDAFYYGSVGNCDIPLFTSFTGTNEGNLLTVLGSAPVTDASFAIDNSLTTASKIGSAGLLGLGVANHVEQIVYLPQKTNTKTTRVVMKMPAGLLNIDLGAKVKIVFYDSSITANGGYVGETILTKEILGLNLLGLINTDDTKFSFATAPKDANGNIIAYDKIGIRVEKGVGVSLLNSHDIEVYDVAVINDKPIVAKVCTKEFVSAVAGVDIRETKFDLRTIIPNFNAANTYLITDSKGNTINVNTDFWQPLGAYVIRGITGSAIYCPNDNVSFNVLQDTRYRIGGKTSVSISIPNTGAAQTTFVSSDFIISDYGAGNGVLSNVSNLYEPVRIYRESDNADVTGQVLTFPQIGSYNFYAKTKSIANANCELVKRVTVYVYDKAICEYRYQQLGANFQKYGTVSLLGIPLGGTSKDNKSIDSTLQESPGLSIYDLSTHESVFNIISLLGIGTTWQDLIFKNATNPIDANTPNKEIPAGTPLTVKLGQDYSLLQVLGGITLRVIDTNGNAIGPFLSVDEFDLANVLVGDNVFEYTFIPKNENGIEIKYSGVRIHLGSVLGLGNSLKVYGAFIDERIPTSAATCNPNILISGAESRVRNANGEFDSTLNGRLLLNRSTRDVLWGTKDIGLGVATLLSSVIYPYLAADAIDSPGSPLHGTPNFDTAAVFNTSVSALNAMSLTVKFKEIARPGDKVRVVLGSEGSSILDANILGTALSIQRYMGDIAIGNPVVIQANSLIKLDLLSLIDSQKTGKYVYLLDQIGAPFDRVQLQLGNVVNAQLLAPKLRIYDVSLLPFFAFDSNAETTILCVTKPFEIEKMDPCTSYELSYAFATLDANKNITSWNDIPNSVIEIKNENNELAKYQLLIKDHLKTYNRTGNLYMKVVTKRQGCIYGDVQYLKIELASCKTIANPMIRTRFKSN